MTSPRRHRSTLATAFGKATGLEVDAPEIITAASAAAAYTAAHRPRERLLVLAAPDARREWAGQTVVSPDEADDGTEPVGAVVIGDTVWFSTLEQQTRALGARTGMLIWKINRGQFNPVVSDGQRLYLVGHSSLTALEPKRKQPAAKIISELYSAVVKFVGPMPQPDDLTALVVKRV